MQLRLAKSSRLVHRQSLKGLLAALIVTFCFGAGSAGAVAHPSAPKVADGHSAIAPYSSNPTELRPFAICPPATATRATCAAIGAVNPAKRKTAGLPVPAFEGSGVNGAFSPADLQAAYKLPNSTGTNGTVVIVIPYDDPNLESDLATYRQKYGLPACTSATGCFAKLNWKGEEGNYPAHNETWAGEVSLDVDMASAACPGCKIRVVEAENAGLAALAIAAEFALTHSWPGVPVVSDSWLMGEFKGENEYDHYFNHPGTPILFASGDEGARITYPAASPYVIAVGGTSLSKAANSRGWTEQAWVNAGSGCSAYEPKPSWQGETGCTGRAVADISAVADPFTPVSVYNSYESSGWQGAGGTSASAPFVAGFEALTNETFRQGGVTSFQYAAEGGLFNDPTIGETGGYCGMPACQAEPGYDGPTGWGTPETIQTCNCGPSETTNDTLALRPVVTAEHYKATSQSSVEFTALVDTEGLETSWGYEYGKGETGTYEHSTVCATKLTAKEAEYLSVSCKLTSLSGNTFHYRIFAENKNGRRSGPDHPFTTALPEVLSESGSAEGATRAWVYATISAGETTNGGKLSEGPETRYWFEFGPTTSYGQRAPLRKGVMTKGVASESVKTRIVDLIPSTQYHYRVVVDNGNGNPTYGADATFRTKSPEWLEAPLPDGVDKEKGENYERTNAQSYSGGIDCPTVVECITVGKYFRNGEYEAWVPSAQRWVDGSWRAMEITPPEVLKHGEATARRGTLQAVSCSSPSLCTAIGNLEKFGSLTGEFLAYRWNGTSWTQQSIPSPEGAVQGELTSVSCSWETNCVAVGWYKTSGTSATRKMVVETWNGSTWSATYPAGVGAGEFTLKSVSCASTSLCVAVGYRSTATAYKAPLIMKYTTGWAEATVANPGAAELNSVSCPTTTFCEAVGASWTTGVSWPGEAQGKPLVEKNTGGSVWSTEQQVYLPESRQAPAVGGVLRAVDCIDASTCVAVGVLQMKLERQKEDLVETLSGGSWYPGHMSSQEPLLTFSNISCHEATCAAAGTESFATGKGFTVPGAVVDVKMAPTAFSNALWYQGASSPLSVMSAPAPTLSSMTTPIRWKMTIGSIPVEVSATGYECIECTFENREVQIGKGVQAAGYATLKFTGVTVLKPSGCVVHSSRPVPEGVDPIGVVRSERLNAFADISKPTETAITFAPAAELKRPGESVPLVRWVFSRNTEIEGSSCSIAGNHFLYGTARAASSPNLLSETASRTISFGGTGLTANAPAPEGVLVQMEGSLLEKLASGLLWTAR